MKYKVGDKVRVKNIDWYNKNKNKKGLIKCGANVLNLDMCKFCGSTVTIDIANYEEHYYSIIEDKGYWMWTDEMIEGLVEEETYDFLKTDKPNLPSLNDFMDMLDNEIKLPDGYIFKDENGNVINAQKIVLEKKKKEYPKTFVEVLDFWYPDRQLEDDYQRSYKKDLIKKFQDLLYARDAYWKIAGEEMGLSKPWEPDWTYNGATKYCIGVSENEIQNFSSSVAQYILAFPTEEMRDTFYENFKELIESCKELL